MELNLPIVSFILNVSPKRIRFIYLLAFLLYISNSVNAQGNTPEIGLKLATGQHYSPFVDDKLPGGGWSVRIIKQVLLTMSLKAEIVILPWERALQWTVSDRIFGTFPFVYSKRRAEKFLYSEPINFVPVHMYVAKKSSFSSPSSLMTKRLCFPYDYALSPIEQKIVDEFQMTVNRVKDGIGCVKHVQKGWSDAGLTNGYIDTSKLSEAHKEGKEIKIFTRQLALVPLYFLISKERKNAQVWMDEFNYALLIIEKNGKKSAIKKQYLQLMNKFKADLKGL